MSTSLVATVAPPLASNVAERYFRPMISRAFATSSGGIL
jgi:hypothetical protein